MFEKILVPIDFSDGSRYAASTAMQVPGVREIVLLHVLYNRYKEKKPSHVNPQIEGAMAGLEALKSSFGETGIRVRMVIEEIAAGEISDIIIRTAARQGISLVVMGRRGAGVIETLLLGSVASDMVRYGKIDLLLVPPPGMSPHEVRNAETLSKHLYDHVMVCTDFSEPEIAMLCLEGLSPMTRASLLHVVTSSDSRDGIRAARAQAEARLESLRDAFARRGIPAGIHVAVGGAPEEILAFSRHEDISLIVMKSTGRKSFLNALIGSTSAPVARNAKKPVLILKRPALAV